MLRTSSLDRTKTAWALAIDAELHAIFGARLAPHAELHVVETGADLRHLAAPKLRGMILRTEQRVDPALCARFPELEVIATASAGTDHIDAPPGIQVLDAGGGNADGVADWVVLSLLRRFGFEGRRPRVGLLGCGNTGSRVAGRLRTLGFPLILVDPPRARRDSSFTSAPLDALFDAEVLSFHVPLNPRGSEDQTEAWLDAERISAWRRPFHLLNAARGPVVDEAAALEALDSGALASWSADVLANERDPDPSLLAALALVTPHIAGRSDDGRLGLQQRCLQAVTQAFGLDVEPLEDLPVLARPCPAPEEVWPFLDKLSGLPGIDARLRAAPKTYKTLRHAHRRRDLRAVKILGGSPELRALLATIGLSPE